MLTNETPKAGLEPVPNPDSAARTVAESVTKAATKPATHSTAKPATHSTAKPATHSTAESTSTSTPQADGNKVNGNFIRRQQKLTEIVTDLCEPNKADLFPLIVGVDSLDDETPTLYFPAQAPTSVSEDLLGFVAPAGWEAVIVAAEGSAHNVTEDGPEDDRDVIVGYGLGRRGEEVSVLQLPDEEAMISTLPSEGRVLDCCRRVLGQDTPPAKESTIELIIASWLERIFARVTVPLPDPSAEVLELLAAAGSPEPVEAVEPAEDIEHLDWEQLVALHPLLGAELSGGAMLPLEVGERARQLCSDGTWGRIRRAVASGEIEHGSITAAQAKWMDDAMFSRWCLADFADSDSAIDILGQLLPGELYDQLLLCLDEHRKLEPMTEAPAETAVAAEAPAETAAAAEAEAQAQPDSPEEFEEKGGKME